MLVFALLCCVAMASGSHRERSEVAGWGGKKQVVDKLDQILDEMTSDGSPRPAILGVHIMELREYVETPGRKYTVFALLTPPDTAWGCGLCQYAYNEFYTVALSHAQAPADPAAADVYFVVVDLGELAEEAARAVPPDVMVAPAIVMFKRNGAPDPEHLDYQQGGLEAEDIARWVYRQTGVRIKIVRTAAQAYGRVLYLAGVSLIVARVLAGLGLRWESLVTPRTLAIAAAGFCCLMTGGDMWNRIRRPMFFVTELTEGSNQLTVDTYVVAFLYGGVVTGMILIIEARGGVPRAPRRRSPRLRWGPAPPPTTDMRLVSGLGLVCVFFSAVISFYRSRVQQYPFRLLFP